MRTGKIGATSSDIGPCVRKDGNVMNNPRDDEPPVIVVQTGCQSAQAEGGAGTEENPEVVEQPAKVMRIGSMIRQLLEEVRQAPLDDASRARLREIYDTSLRRARRRACRRT